MKLKRKLGFWGVFCIASGAMISSGLFVLPGLAFKHAGPAVVLSYALAGVMVIPALLSKAELATAMPKSGGTYFFIHRSMGALPGMLAGLAGWFSIALKSAFALIGIGAFAQLIRPGTDEWVIKAIAIGCCVLFTILNIVSVKGVGRLQIVLVAILLGILGVFVSYGMPATRYAHFEDFMDKGMLSVLATAGIVFVSFGGLTKVASIAEEVRNPGRNIPAGMFASALVVTLFYVAVVFVTVGVLDPGTLEGRGTPGPCLTPLSLAAKEFLGKPGMIILSIGAMLAFITTANGGIMAASRTPMAMSRDGLLPAAMKKLSGRFATPLVSILVTSGFMIAAIASLRIENLVKAASTMMLMLFAMVSLSVIIMRSSGIQNYRPLYKAPFYPWLQIAGIAVYLFLIADMGTVPLLATLIFVLAGVLWYVLYVRTRIAGESAFVYMVKNIVSKDIYRSQLEEELKEIALERDEVTHDRFDRLIKDCEILDLEGPLSAEQLFRRSAEALAPRLNIDQQKLLDLLTRREGESSTVIQPGLAIPHIIVDGRKLFDILPIRCKEGVTFPGHDQPVQVAFILAGSRDERNYHLRALMAIAHIVQEEQFVERWLNAPEAEHLRDILLLSGRKRDHGN